MDSENLRHFITRIVLGEPRAIAISAEEYQNLVKAQKRLATILGLEQKFDLILWAFEEYEEELLRLALYRMVWTGTGLEALRDGWHVVNRRVLNLLSASRLYLDQLMVDLSAIYGKESEIYTAIKEATNRLYDEHLAYRAMEGLRNHAQHCSLPVSSVSYPMRIDRERPDVIFRFSVLPLLNLAELRQHGAVKSAVIDELEQLSLKPSLSPLLRQYVECLGNIHEELRLRTASDVAACDHMMEDVRERAKEAFDGETIGLGIVARNESDHNVKSVYLWHETISERKRLQSKSKVLVNFARRYVTSAEEEETP